MAITLLTEYETHNILCFAMAKEIYLRTLTHEKLLGVLAAGDRPANGLSKKRSPLPVASLG